MGALSRGGQREVERERADDTPESGDRRVSNLFRSCASPPIMSNVKITTASIIIMSIDSYITMYLLCFVTR